MVLIEDYALVGDLQSAALVGAATARSTGSACRGSTPRRASRRCSATAEHGRWRLAPAGAVTAHLPPVPARDARAGDGVRDGRRCRARDRLHAAPRRRAAAADADRRGPRAVACRCGWSWRVRADYGSIRPWVEPAPDGVVAIAGPDAFRLSTPRRAASRGRHGRARSSSAVEGGRERFTLGWWPSHEASPPVEDADSALARTEAWWQEWSGRCTYRGEYRDAVLTSLIALKAMTSRVDRRAHRGADHVAARGPRRRRATGTTATAGCATPCSRSRRCSPAGTPTRRSRFRDFLLRVATGRSGRDADHVRRRRRAAADGVRAARTSRATRARGPSASATPPRSSSSSTSTARSSASRSSAPSASAASEDAPLAALARDRRPRRDGLARAGRRDLGGARPARHYTYSKVMAWVVFDRARPARGALRARRAGRALVARPATRSTGRCASAGYDPARGDVHAVLRLDRARRQHADDPARRVPAGHRRPRDGHDRRGDARASAGTASSRATRPTRPTTGSPAARASSWRARSGWSARSRSTAASTRRERCSSGCSSCATTSACSPRSTTSTARRQVGNFPQAFSHLALIEAAQAITAAATHPPGTPAAGPRSTASWPPATA